MTFAARFYCHSGRATPSRRVSKIAKPRIQHNPAGIHLKSAGRCPNNRCQFLYLVALFDERAQFLQRREMQETARGLRFD